MCLNKVFLVYITKHKREKKIRMTTNTVIHFLNSKYSLCPIIIFVQFVKRFFKNVYKN